MRIKFYPCRPKTILDECMIRLLAYDLSGENKSDTQIDLVNVFQKNTEKFITIFIRTGYHDIIICNIQLI
jgi:hypothetical protein